MREIDASSLNINLGQFSFGFHFLQVLSQREFQDTCHNGVWELTYDSVVLRHRVIEHHSAHTHLVLIIIEAVHRLGVCSISLQFRILLRHKSYLGGSCDKNILLSIGIGSCTGTRNVLTLLYNINKGVILVLVI